MASVIERFKTGWNAFRNADYSSKFDRFSDHGTSSGRSQVRTRSYASSERTILASITTRIAIDAAAVSIWHVKTDEEGRFLTKIKSGLNNCLTVEANLDQAARHFRQDVVQTLLDKGTIGIVPVDVDIDPALSGGYDIRTLRVGIIKEWHAQFVTVDTYDERTGERKDIFMSKSLVAIVENPLYNVMNEQNSTMQRLLRKLTLLDMIDEQVSSGRLDIIIQLPFVVKSDARRAEAEKRRKAIEEQLSGTGLGIAYTDATEHITQLNRPVENTMLKQVEYLQNSLYNQLGLTEEIISGTANESTMINYFNRTTEPILAAITEAMARTFLTVTARTQGQTIKYFRDPFKLLSLANLAEIGDKLTRNEIVSSNEMRGAIGMKPSTDPKADQLINKNLPEPVPEET